MNRACSCLVLLRGLDLGTICHRKLAVPGPQELSWDRLSLLTGDYSSGAHLAWQDHTFNCLFKSLGDETKCSKNCHCHNHFHIFQSFSDIFIHFQTLSANSCHFQSLSAISSQFLAISWHFQSSPAISSHFKSVYPFPANSSQLHQSLAISSHFQPCKLQGLYDW